MVSRRTKAIIELALSLALLAFQLASYLIGKRYAVAVEADRAPSRAKLQEQLESWTETKRKERARAEDPAAADELTKTADESAETADEAQKREDATARLPETADELSQDAPIARPDHLQMTYAQWAEQYGDRQINSRWIGVGFFRTILRNIAYDYDVYSLRNKRFPRFLLGIVTLSINRHLLDENATFSKSLGSLLGSVCYRTVFGLLREPPGPDQ